MKKIFTYSLIVFAGILLILTGCSNESQPIAKGSVKISITDSIAKGIEPNISMDAAYFIINGEFDSFDKVSDLRIEYGEIKTLESLASGTWTFSAVAYNDNGDAIGRSNPTQVEVLPGKTTEASLTVYEEVGNGTLLVKLNTDDLLNTYTLHVFKLVDGALAEVGVGKVFTEAEIGLAASVTLERGFYTFSIDCTGPLIKLPPVEGIRIVAGDTVIASYDIDDSGNISVTIENTIAKTPSVSISIAEGMATAIASNMGSGNLDYTWYADRTKLEFSGSSIDISTLTEYSTITCVVQNTASGIVWVQTIEL